MSIYSIEFWHHYYYSNALHLYHNKSSIYFHQGKDILLFIAFSDQDLSDTVLSQFHVTTIQNDCIKRSIFKKDHIKTLSFDKSDVIKLIKALDVSKTDGHDGISVKMIKICADYIAHPLTLIFQNSLVAGVLSAIGKKLTLFQFIKKMISKLYCFKLQTSFFFTDM